MYAARYHGRRDVRVENVERDVPTDTEVRVEVSAAGICGTDLHEYVGGPISIPVDEPHPLTGETLPVTLGHEFAGVVEARAGPCSLDVGQTVVVNPILCCRSCQYCLSGEYRLCVSGGAVGKSGGGGGFAESVVVPAEQAVVVPPELSAEHAALVEPFCVALHAVRQSRLRPGATVAVFGAGPIGLAIQQAARAAGASEVYVSEPNDTRRKLASELDAAAVVDPGRDDPVAFISNATAGGVDIAFEAAGVGKTLEQSVRSTRKTGEVVVVSIFEDRVAVDPNEITTTERTVTGSLGYRTGPRASEEFQPVIEMLADGTFHAEPLITSRIPLESIIERGFERLLEVDNDDVKVLVTP